MATEGYDISDPHMDDPDFDPAIHLAWCLIAIRDAHPLHTNSDICPICLPLLWSQLDFEGIPR